MTTRPMTAERIAREMFNSISLMGHWNYERRLEWLRWAAWNQTCPKCGAEPRKACENLADRKRTPTRLTYVRSPHDERIDWFRMIDGLHERGYIDDYNRDLTLKAMREAE